jgi:hypothetical protein
MKNLGGIFLLCGVWPGTSIVIAAYKPFHIHVSEWQGSKLPECNDSVFAYIFPDERYVAYLQGN